MDEWIRIARQHSTLAIGPHPWMRPLLSCMQSSIQLVVAAMYRVMWPGVAAIFGVMQSYAAKCRVAGMFTGCCRHTCLDEGYMHICICLYICLQQTLYTAATDLTYGCNAGCPALSAHEAYTCVCGGERMCHWAREYMCAIEQEIVRVLLSERIYAQYTYATDTQTMQQTHKHRHRRWRSCSRARALSHNTPKIDIHTHKSMHRDQSAWGRAARSKSSTWILATLDTAHTAAACPCARTGPGAAAIRVRIHRQPNRFFGTRNKM